jgi:hypothetical protein
MAQWLGICGVRLEPLVALLKEFVLGQDVIHCDETPVSLLAPGKGKTKKAYVWVYRTTNFIQQRAVYYNFCNSRSGEHPRRVLAGFSATLVSDDYSGYHALHRSGVTAALCWAHARRKLFEAYEHTGSERCANWRRTSADCDDSRTPGRSSRRCTPGSWQNARPWPSRTRPPRPSTTR